MGKAERQRAFLDATAGAMAGCVARFAVGPLDVLKIRFQVQLEPFQRKGATLLPGQLAPKYTSLAQAFRTIVREEGIQVRFALPSHPCRGRVMAPDRWDPSKILS